MYIRNNFIGVRRNSGTGGDIQNGNTGTGIYIYQSTVGPIGGNQIGDNGGHGIEIRDSTVLVVQQNLIGSSASNLSQGIKIGNKGAGVVVSGSTSGLNIIGNTIANNGSAGIAVTETADRIQHISNVFLGNAGVAFDIGLDGVTPNDENDTDGGPNARLNTPVLRQDTVQFNPSTGQWQVTMDVDVDSSGLYDIQLYQFDTRTKQYSRIFESSITVASVGLGVDESFALPIPAGVAGNEYSVVLLGNNQQGSNLRNQDRASEFSAPITLGNLKPPRVNGFVIKSPTATVDYVPRVASGQQYVPITGSGLNVIQITFDQAVVIGNGTTNAGINSLSLKRSDGVTLTPISFSMSGNTASWTFSSAGGQSLQDGKYALLINAQSVKRLSNNEYL